MYTLSVAHYWDGCYLCLESVLCTRCHTHLLGRQWEDLGPCPLTCLIKAHKHWKGSKAQCFSGQGKEGNLSIPCRCLHCLLRSWYSECNRDLQSVNHREASRWMDTLADLSPDKYFCVERESKTVLQKIRSYMCKCYQATSIKGSRVDSEK